jgi:hypothetical protein
MRVDALLKKLETVRTENPERIYLHRQRHTRSLTPEILIKIDAAIMIEQPLNSLTEKTIHFFALVLLPGLTGFE